MTTATRMSSSRMTTMTMMMIRSVLSSSSSFSAMRAQAILGPDEPRQRKVTCFKGSLPLHYKVAYKLY